MKLFKVLLIITLPIIAQSNIVGYIDSIKVPPNNYNPELLPEYKETFYVLHREIMLYDQECYNDSIWVENEMRMTQSGGEYKYMVAGYVSYYKHTEPTFTGFIEYIKNRKFDKWDQ